MIFIYYYYFIVFGELIFALALFNVSWQLEESQRRLSGALCFCLLCPLYAQHRTMRVQSLNPGFELQTLMSNPITVNSEYNTACCLAHHRAVPAVYILPVACSF